MQKWWFSLFFFFLLSVQILSLLIVELPLGQGHEGCYWNIRLHNIVSGIWTRLLLTTISRINLQYVFTRLSMGFFVFSGILSQVYEELVVKRRSTKNNTLEKSFLIYFRLFSLTLLTWQTVSTITVLKCAWKLHLWARQSQSGFLFKFLVYSSFHSSPCLKQSTGVRHKNFFFFFSYPEKKEANT